MIQIKNAYQIKKIKEASAILSRVLQAVLSQITVGAVPTELDLFARKKIKALGAEPSFLGYHGFPAALCISIDAVVIHGIPSVIPLRAGQVVGIDCGIRLGNYYSDAAHTVAVGVARSDHAQLIALGEQALRVGIAALNYGNRISDYSQAVQSIARQHNLGIITEYCGHGVGLAIHEEPSIPNYFSAGSRQRLVPGMVLAVEPMFSLGNPAIFIADDKWSVATKSGEMATHCEHTVLITDNEAEVLTA